MKPFTLLSLCLLLLCGRLAQAETSAIQLAQLSEEDYLGEVPQVLTIARLRQSASDTPSASTIIDRDTIRAAGIIDLPEIFRLVPGLLRGHQCWFYPKYESCGELPWPYGCLFKKYASDD